MYCTVCNRLLWGLEQGTSNNKKNCKNRLLDRIKNLISSYRTMEGSEVDLESYIAELYSEMQRGSVIVYVDMRDGVLL